MGICCSKAAAGDLDDDEGGFPWMHDDLFHHHLWTSAAVSMHTKQGWKGANQDAMTVCQDFAGHKGHIFCGVFDGHGPLGREVARHVRDTLPIKLSSALKPKAEEEDPSTDTSKSKTEEEDPSTDTLKPKTEDHLSNTLKLRTEEYHSSDNLKLIRTVEDHSSNNMKFKTEEDPSTDTLKLRTEEGHSSNNANLIRTEEDQSSDNLKFRTEEDPSTDTLKLRTEEGHPSNNNVNLIRTEEDQSSDNLKFRSEEDPSSNNTDPDSFDKSDSSSFSDTSDENQLLSTWKNIFTMTFEEVDGELRQHSGIDCICSGTTAVTVVRQGDHLFIANLGDSRAVLCTRDSKDRLIPLQLTTDLKPDLPCELARILNCKGRVFAMDDEPDVPRMWLPDQDAPGLAMARAFGDFCLKNHGLICTPEVYYRKLSEKDEFLVLATDGIWDVLSNKQVVKIVSSATDPSKAARQLIDRAVRAWRRKYPTSMVDDCAVVCLFLNRAASPAEGLSVTSGGEVKPPPPAASFTGSFRKALSGGEAPEEGTTAWRALEGVARANSVIRLPRIGRVLSWRRRSNSLDDDEDDQN